MIIGQPAGAAQLSLRPLSPDWTATPKGGESCLATSVPFADTSMTNKREAASGATCRPTEAAPAYDPDRAAKLFRTKCSQCHQTKLVESVPPKSEAEARSLVARMVEEGLSASEAELAEIVRYLTTTYAAGSKE